jgi:hypothetical protein
MAVSGDIPVEIETRAETGINDLKAEVRLKVLWPVHDLEKLDTIKKHQQKMADILAGFLETCSILQQE